MEVGHDDSKFSNRYIYFIFRIYVPFFLKINIKRSQILGGIAYLTTRTDKDFMRCVSVKSGIMTQYLCVTQCDVRANAKGPGPLS